MMIKSKTGALRLGLDSNEENMLFLRKGEVRHDNPLVDPLTPYGVQPVGHAGYRDPVFSDEFRRGPMDADKWIPWYPDTSFWATTVPGGHKTNTGEPQGYDETGISFDENGMVFTLHESNHAVPELDFTSGMVCSYPSFNPLYGYFEAKMRITNVAGAWPAFWMDRTDQTWPPEIDIMENWARGDGNNRLIKQTLIWPTSRSDAQYAVPEGEEFGDKFHVFGALWEPGRLRWYVDGNMSKDFSGPEVPSDPMYLICNLAGDNSHIPDVVTSAPFSVHVAYIRAWDLIA